MWILFLLKPHPCVYSCSPTFTEVVVDIDKRCYKALGFRKMNLLNLGPALLAKVSRDAIAKVSVLPLQTVSKLFLT